MLQLGNNDTLALEQVRKEDGGEYICEVETINGVKHNATSTLVIFGESFLKLKDRSNYSYSHNVPTHE